MRCVQCGGDYIGMKRSRKFNCPHCVVVKATVGANDE